MSALGNIAVEGELRRLLDLLDRMEREGASTEERLATLRKEMEDDMATASKGWL